MTHLLRLLLVVGLFVSHAAAQTPPGAQPGAPAVKVSLYVRAPDGALKGLSYLQNGKPVPLRVSSGRRTNPVALSGTTEFKVVREEKDATGKAIQKEVGKVALPAGAKNVLLLGAYRNGVINFLPINLDAASFPAGSLRVLNYAGAPVALRLGGESKLIENGGSAQMGPYPPSPKARECSFAAQAAPENNWRIFSTRGVVFDAEGRFLMIVVSPSQPGGEPEVIVIRDVLPKPAPRQS